MNRNQLVSGSTHRTALSAGLLLAALAAPGQAGDPQSLVASDGQGGQYFGASLSAEGTHLLAGAYRDDDRGLESGSAYVFELVGAGFVETAKLLASDGMAGDWFGHSVALAGDLAVVGAQGHDAVFPDSGAGYVFQNVSGSWVEVAKLLPSKSVASGYFGGAVATDGTRVVIASANQHFPHLDTGHNRVWIFEDQGAGWVQTRKLLPLDFDPADWFGASVDVDGDVIVVGAPREGQDVSGYSTGAAYVFERLSVGWVETAKLTDPASSSQALFGRAVAVSGNRIVIGAPEEGNGAAGGPGAAYVFERAGASWLLVTKLTAFPTAPVSSYGVSVATLGEQVLVGAAGSFVGTPGAGEAFLYEQVQSRWLEVGNPEAAGDDAGHLGSAVALTSDRVVLAAPISQGARGEVLVHDLGSTAIGLGIDADQISFSAGGSVGYLMQAGAAHAGKAYWLLGSLSGSLPGTVVGAQRVPLNFDAYFQFLLQRPNTVIQRSFGILDTSGRALAELFVPAGSGPPPPFHLWHAFVVLDAPGIGFVSGERLTRLLE